MEKTIFANLYDNSQLQLSLDSRNGVHNILLILHTSPSFYLGSVIDHLLKRILKIFGPFLGKKPKNGPKSTFSKYGHVIYHR